jgi:hypothetical protein
MTTAAETTSPLTHLDESAMREVPAPRRGSGAVTCCGGHRERCIFGNAHIWGTWYEDGKLQRTAQTFYCHVCSGVCTADEDEDDQ